MSRTFFFSLPDNINLSSTFPCTQFSTVQKIRYTKPTSKYITSGSYVLAVIRCVTRNISVTVMVEAKDVSFTNAIKLLNSGGIAIFVACGKNREELEAEGATYVVDYPHEIKEIIDENRSQFLFGGN